jgi:hypothetical protein
MTVLEPFEAAFSFTPVAKEERIVCEEEEEEERSRVGDEEREVTMAPFVTCDFLTSRRPPIEETDGI